MDGNPKVRLADTNPLHENVNKNKIQVVGIYCGLVSMFAFLQMD